MTGHLVIEHFAVRANAVGAKLLAEELVVALAPVTATDLSEYHSQPGTGQSIRSVCVLFFGVFFIGGPPLEHA